MKQKLMAVSAMTAAAALLLAGCATSADPGAGGIVFDVPDVPMLEALGDAEGNVDIVAWSGFVEPAWADTFTDEVREELGRCMWGTAPINVRVHIDDIRRADRLGVLLNGDGVHTLSGTVEFVDPADGNRVLTVDFAVARKTPEVK
jgi:hypothetical protein